MVEADAKASAGEGDVALNEDEPHKIKNESLQYVFAPKRDHFPAKAYADDGNPEMYTKENIKRREQLSEDPTVRQAIENFIAANFELNKSNKSISKDEYMKVFINIGMILRRDLIE